MRVIMTRITVRRIAAVAAVLGLVAWDAAAWGPRARKALGKTSMQLISRTHRDVFGTPDNWHDGDVIRGITDFWDVFDTETSPRTDAQAVALIGNEIQLLREARKHSSIAYFSYRMGALAGLVGEVMLPFGNPATQAEERLKRQIEDDIDERVESFLFKPNGNRRLHFVRLPKDYFRKARTFYDDAATIIAHDYAKGDGYDGYMRQGAEVFFGKAVEAIGDVWHTVLEPPAEDETVPSPQALTWYYVDEIDYLLTVKGNLAAADRAYDVFVDVNPGIVTAYEEVGDRFYAAGEEERGVKEWEKALRLHGPRHREVTKKLADHYLRKGRALLQLASSEEGKKTRDSNLQSALYALTKALEYDQANPEAAELHNETMNQIAERELLRQIAIDCISKAERMIQSAEASEKSGSLAGALADYNHALTVLDAKEIDEFPAQAEAAEESRTKVANAIREITDDLLNEASQAIATGDDHLSADRFDQAIQSYRNVETILAAIVDEQYDAEKRELIDQANEKINQVQIEKQRYQQRQQAATGGPPAGAGGGG